MRSQAVLRNDAVLRCLEQARRETDIEESAPKGIARPGVVRVALSRCTTSCSAAEHDPPIRNQNVTKYAHVQ